MAAPMVAALTSTTSSLLVSLRSGVGILTFFVINQAFTADRFSAASRDSNSRRLGLISRGRPTQPATASTVLRPLPVTQRTAESLAGILPEAMRFFAPPPVTPPAGFPEKAPPSAGTLVPPPL